MSELFYLKDCFSTNDEVARFLLYPSSDFVGVYTFNQKKGRGQYGNTWDSVPEKNLAFTLAVKTENVSFSDFLFNYYTAILIQEYVAKLTEKEVKIKWPNDIILKNKKIAGILIEKTRINGENYFIIGVGINILQKKFTKISNAGSIFTQTNRFFDLHRFAKGLFEFLNKKLKVSITEDEILKDFNSKLFKKDMISVFEIDGARQNGIIKNADEKGEIWIELENGLRSFYHKEIKLLY